MAAILWMLAAASLVTVMSALVKTLGQTLPAPQMAAVRGAFLVAALLPFMLRQSGPVFRPSRPGLLALRALTLLIVNVVGFWALTKLPLVYVTSIGFSKPLFITLFAILLLGERIRLRRTLATLTGFAGVLLMLNPATVEFGSVQLWAAIGALSVAIAMGGGVIVVKKLAETDHPNTIIFYSNSAVVLTLALPAGLYWVAPTPTEWGLLVLLGLVGLASQNCFIRAYRAAEASFVAPFEYTRILSAGLVGLVFFDEAPDIWTGVGAGLIVASTYYIARREAQLGKGAKAPGNDDS